MGKRTHHETDIVSHPRFVSMSDPNVPNELQCAVRTEHKGVGKRVTHLRSKGIDDLTCEGLCELEDKKD